MDPLAAAEEFDLHLRWPSGTSHSAGRRTESRPPPPPVPSAVPTKRQIRPAGNGAVAEGNGFASSDLRWLLGSLDRLVGRLESMIERLELVQNATTAHVAALDSQLNEQIDAVSRLGRQVGRLVSEGAAVRVRR
jgi:hypothetical protein